MANNPSILRGNGKPLQYPCLEDAMKSMKRQKDITLEDEALWPEVIQYATGEEQRNSLRKNEDAGHK